MIIVQFQSPVTELKANNKFSADFNDAPSRRLTYMRLAAMTKDVGYISYFAAAQKPRMPR